MDGNLQPRIGGLFHGVSRQAPLQRAPNQCETIDNYLPTVDVGGLVDRAGTSLLWSAPRSSYLTGPHHFYRSTDGQRWVLLRRNASGEFEVRNADTGVSATLVMDPLASYYLRSGTGLKLKFLTIADTTLILNTEVTAAVTIAPVPQRTSAYVFVKRMSSAAQSLTVMRTNGGFAKYTASDGNSDTRESAASKLANAVNAAPALEITASVVGHAPYLVRLTGTAEAIESLSARNSWDGDALVLIKHRVTATADLPPQCDDGVSIAVDLGRGEQKTVYYVRYDLKKNGWIECSYADLGATTATFNGNTMPVRMTQTGDTEFRIDVCEWTERDKGDDSSNPAPFFAGKRIYDLATWKGRLILACEDTLSMSRPDDLFNYWKETARESRPADPIELPTDSPDLSVIHHVVAFRNKLIVTADNAQLEVPGDKPLTPEDATIGVATRYALDKDCRPVVVGDSLYYTGTVQRRAALWEYVYDDGAASNVAFDLSKHVPGYVPGKVLKIAGAAQSGRLYLRTAADPAALFTHTTYWKDGQRVQNAWTRLSFPGFTSILDFWVDEDRVLVLGETANRIWLVSFAVDADLDEAPESGQRIDFRTSVTATWNGSYTVCALPAGYGDLGPLIATVHRAGDGWVTEYEGETVGTEFRVPVQLAAGPVTVGKRYSRSVEFSPFYMTVDDSTTPMGRLQVRKVILDFLRTGDFTATVTRKDRSPPMRVQRTARVVGQAWARPVIAENVQFSVPYNSRGDAAALVVAADSTAPSVITGFTLMARYTNPY